MASVVLMAIVALTTGCSSKKKEPVVVLPPPSFTYSSPDVTPWPWRITQMTVTCTDLGGSSTAVVNGKTYGLTGRDAIHSRIRGYESYSSLLSNPDAGYDTTLAFDARVERDCKNAYRARGEDVPG